MKSKMEKLTQAFNNIQIVPILTNFQTTGNDNEGHSLFRESTPLDSKLPPRADIEAGLRAQEGVCLIFFVTKGIITLVFEKS